MELCMDEGMQMYKVMSMCELLGLRAAMEEDEVERILGTDPVHMTEDGFVTLAENLIRTLDNPATLFAGEKRSREEQVEGGGWWAAGGGRRMSGCTTRCRGREPEEITG